MRGKFVTLPSADTISGLGVMADDDISTFSWGWEGVVSSVMEILYINLNYLMGFDGGVYQKFVVDGYCQ